MRNKQELESARNARIAQTLERIRKGLKEYPHPVLKEPAHGYKPEVFNESRS